MHDLILKGLDLQHLELLISSKDVSEVGWLASGYGIKSGFVENNSLAG
jgi:hypothetical protein